MTKNKEGIGHFAIHLVYRNWGKHACTCKCKSKVGAEMVLCVRYLLVIIIKRVIGVVIINEKGKMGVKWMN